jgi:demethylmenaquinone methyltransferase/2-methoxy-6-polyprenyl-1,4-benzoquinol methylase
LASFCDHGGLLREQVAYYEARANEYDEWFFRKGRYDRGLEVNQQWFREVEEVRQALDAFKPSGRVLELACGTGLWTEQLLRHATHITAVDAASEMLSINQARVQSSKVRYVQADLFEWRPPERFDIVFFGFWLSHVPRERFAAFWALVDSALEPSGRVFFVDSRYDSTSTAKDHHLEGAQSTTATRRLNDGRQFQIVKVFYDSARLTVGLAGLGWDFSISETAHYLIHGHGGRRVE